MTNCKTMIKLIKAGLSLVVILISSSVNFHGNNTHFIYFLLLLLLLLLLILLLLLLLLYPLHLGLTINAKKFFRYKRKQNKKKLK